MPNTVNCLHIDGEDDINVSLYDIYKDILSDEKRWNFTLSKEIEHNFPNVLAYPKSYNFLIQNLFSDANLHSLSLQLDRFRDRIPKERLSHTVSLYLFGISVAEVIGFEQFKLSKWDKDKERNFLHYWAGVCMFHDVGYALEEDPCSFGIKCCADINSLKGKLELEYDLMERSSTDLIEKYYEYRSQTMCKIDHGIVGAMLLYDVLMKRDAEMQKMADDGCIMIAEKPMYGDNYRADVKRYALDIARHNMWFADEEHIGVYKKFGLDELIPKEDDSHRISFVVSPMLFLLCLLDTIEPIKTYSDKNKKVEDVLKDCVVKAKKQENQVRLQFSNVTMKKKAKECKSWLDIKVNGDSEIEFSLKKEC